MGGVYRRKYLALLPAALLLQAQAVATADLPALSRLEKGRWQLSDPADDNAKFESICLGDPMRLIKLEHPGLSCSHEVVSKGAFGGSVHYTCPRRGFGRTTVRVETPRLAKIDTQGMANNRPFSYRVEARRVGSC